MNQPLVSIIISVYNGEKWLANCLQSALDQTVSDIEIIAVDDCSTDGSLGILRSFAEKDKRLKIFMNEKNSGQAITTNKGIENSTGEWIAFLDCDDLLAPDFCQVLLAEAKRSGAEIIKGRVRNIELDGSVIETPLKVHEDIMQKSALCFTDSWWSAIYRSDKIRKKIWHHTNGHISEDLMFLVESISLPLKVSCVNNIVYIHIRRENSLSEYNNRTLTKIQSGIDAGVSILQTLNERNVSKTDPYGYRVWARDALRHLGGFHRAKKEERETALQICAARAPQIASLIHCEYPGIKKYLMPVILKILKDDRLLVARMFIFRCYDLAKKINPTIGH